MNALVSTEGFSSTSLQLAQAEVAAVAVAARAKAQVEARYIMALRAPRVWDQVRQDIMKECSRSSFAENKSVWYKKPVGKGVEGLGIRFVEMALRCMKNIHVETPMLFEDAAKEVYEVVVTDLESNLTYSSQVVVSKTVERSKPMDDGTYLAVRKNSFGGNTYTLPARDDEILDKRGALMSKAIRALGLKHIPGDIKDEAESLIKQTRINGVKQDPDMHRKRIVDAFAKIGVKASNLVEFLGHPLDQCSPDQIEELRTMYSTIADGEATWKSYIDNKNEENNKPSVDPLAAAAEKNKAKEPVTVNGTATNLEQQIAQAIEAAKTADELSAATARLDDIKDAEAHDRLNDLAMEKSAALFGDKK